MKIEITKGTHISKKWGYETVIANDKEAGYCGKILTVLPSGNCSSIHYHVLKTETFWVLSGGLCLELYELKWESSAHPGSLELSDFGNPRRLILPAGTGIKVPPYTAHRFWARDKVCEFIEFSTVDNPSDTRRLIGSGPIPLALRKSPS